MLEEFKEDGFVGFYKEVGRRRNFLIRLGKDLYFIFRRIGI